MQKDSKIFVAGHRGLVGSAIVRDLRNKGYDNIVCRTRAELDLLNAEQVAAFFSEEKPDYVFLAAAKVGGIMANNKLRADFLYENLMIQNNVVHESYRSGVKKLLFLGSTCIYPKNAAQPMKEDSLLTDVLEYTNEPYAIAKIAGIKLCESYNIQYGTNFISVMPTNLYGPNDNFDFEKSHVLPALIRKMHLAHMLESKRYDEVLQDMGMNSIEEAVEQLKEHGVYSNRVEIWGTGKPKREFLWSEDMADACVYIMQHVDFDDMIDKDQTEIRNTHINIGTGEDVSISDLALTVKNIVGYKGQLDFNTDKPDGTPRKLTDPAKLHKLGWKHTIALEDGIRRLYQWYLDR